MKELQIQQERKLGKGLSALLGESKSKKIEDLGSELVNSLDAIKLVTLEKINAGIYQPRKNFDQNELEELASSIKENGLIQPIILRKAGEDESYEIIAGERRFRAAKIAGLKEIPAIIKKINNHEALELAIIENVQRTDLSLIEEAEGYRQLINEFSYTQEQIAKKLGKSRSHITNLLRLLNLPLTVRNFLDQKLISMGHARAIVNSNNPEKLANRIISDSLSVRDIEDLVRDEKIEKAKNVPVLIRTESKIRFINSDYLNELENQFSEKLGMTTKISYNSFKNSGKILIKFSELEKIQQLLEKIK
ncbi:MAG: ParB/RepB/Spo0J family partition protein [Rickettsiales bacterium]|nr:ParB/RepB/Spo0J family partition protein [Rickettsiales bacterium]